MKTTFYKLSEAVKEVWGFDPYDGDLNDYIFNGEGSIADPDGDVVVEFKVLKAFKHSNGLQDFEIEITEAPSEILENL